MSQGTAAGESVLRSSMKPAPAGSWLARLLRDRTVQIGIAIWATFAACIPFLAHGAIPFNQPLMARVPYQAQILSEILGPAMALVFMAVVWGLTRQRVVPDVAARVPERASAIRETAGLLLYGAAALIAGQFAGRIFGAHGIGLHLPGSMFGLNDTVSPREVYAWSLYNFAVYAAIPYWFFRRRGYSREQLCLKSSDLRNDTLVIVVIFAMTCLGLFASRVWQLTPKQFAAGGALAFLLSLLGTGLPIMIFLCAILVPRYRKLTGSTAAAVVLGGFTYAALHLAEYWTRYDTSAHAVLSVIFITLFYGGPGMVKSYLTLRTGNAWVHLWSYHAVAPHVTADAPIFVRIFRIG